jgi:hypothetical protein
MFRSMALVSVLVGCGVGEVPLPGGGPDATGGGDGANALCAERLPVDSVAAAHAHTPDGATNVGQNCQTAGCHGLPLGIDAPQFIMSGTAYKPDNATPAAGIEIRLIPDAGGNPLIARTDDAGNFSVISTTNPFPGKTLASGCPTTDAKMITPIANATQGNCNSGDCHLNPGGAAGPINLADL